MFTGIIEGLGKITRADYASKDLKELTIEVETPFTDLVLGESIAINGVCLTVAEITSPQCSVFYLSHETLSRTSFGELKSGSLVNLERALAAQGRLSGHFVQGHVDGIGTITRLDPKGDSHLLELRLPEKLGKYCVEKGSIAIHGVSLTINQVTDQIQDSQSKSESETEISICLIPHTFNHTVFQQLRPGSRVHIEIDILAKYMERLCHTQGRT